MNRIIEKGHRYELLQLDGGDFDRPQMLSFVMRCDPENPDKFPGNTYRHAGTTMQSVLRSILDRLYYLQKQVWSAENVLIIWFLRLSLWLLEFRAARRHGRSYPHGLKYVEFEQLCPTCGHTECNHRT